MTNLSTATRGVSPPASEPGRYFCGDWCDVKTAMDYIDATREWPWEAV